MWPTGFFLINQQKVEVDEEARQLSLIGDYVDREFYLEMYPDVREAGVDPAEHYLRYGWKEGRDPSPDFQTSQYLQNNPDVQTMGICPLVHYVESDSKIDADCIFRKQFERKCQEQVAGRVKKLLGVVEEFCGGDGFDYEAFNDLLFSMFSAEFYRMKKGLNRKLSHNELLKEYLLFDYPNGVVPTPFFNEIYYSRKVEDLELPPIESEPSPLRHWLVYGIKNKIPPTPFYSDEEYLKLNGDLKDYPDWLFSHFVEHGVNEGRRFNKLLLISSDTINGKLFGKGSRTQEVFQYLEADDRAGVAEKALDRMRLFLNSDLAKNIVAKASILEPDIGALEEYQLSIVPPWHDVAYCEYKVIRDMLPRGRYDNVIIMPFCKLGGADYVASVLSRVISKFEKGKTLILRTDQSDWARPDWFPENVDTLDISPQLNVLYHATAIRVLYELIREVNASNVFNVNSRRGFELFERFGSQLSCFTRLHAYYFCADRNEFGVEVGYPVWFFANILENLSTALVDNKQLADTLCTRYSLPTAIARKVRVVYTPNMVPLSPQPIAITQLEMRGRRNKPVILWAGRLDAQKRFDLVVKIADLMPDVIFRCWGKAVLDDPPELNDLPNNIVMEGSFGSFDEIPFSESDGWLYTSEWDGLPTILIECAAVGVPIVASAVGGVPELINNDTGWPVVDAQNPNAYVEAISSMLSDDMARINKAKKLQDLVKKQHALDGYAEAIKCIMFGEEDG